MKTRLISLALLGTVVTLATMSVHSVSAQEANQEQEFEQTTNVECSTGTYGQGQVCGVTTRQYGRQRQEIVIRPHQVVNTALDAQTTAVAMGLVLVGVLSAVGFVKTKAH